MAREAEIAAMRGALELAARGLGTTSPNPVVGCVIMDTHDAVVGEGYHEYAGGAHAEVAALAQARERADGGTLVVTLEPCRRVGRTGPCTDEIIHAGLRRVVCAVRDPGASGGADTLREAGIEVELGVLADEAERVNEAWLSSVRLRRPFVTWKYAASLDGRVAAADGSSRWITGAEARADAHRLRAAADAVVVGAGTLLNDDPELSARVPDARRQPLRVVVDSEGRTPMASRVLNASAPTLIAVAEDARTTPLEGAASVARLPRSGGGLDLTALLSELGAREVVSVLLEGGPTLAAAFLARGLVDRVIAYIAPALIGGGAPPALAGPGTPTIDAVQRLRLDEMVRVGPDVRLTARRVT
ncbi:MAG: bifunctional diaminohydroxyphosphoribosylaminopyrimidine deaminase/5-amino-6-(5-phosphoribosylamino)uracil reductase RibD [Streptosporangiaceae bacterium]